MPPVPPSTEVTAPVMLVTVPSVLLITFTLKVQEVFAASVAPVKLTTPVPAVAVIAPAPQLPVNPLGVDITRPAGSVSVKLTPVNAVEALGLVMLKLSEVDSFSGMLGAPKAFAIVGGEMPAAVTVAEAVLPVPPSTEVTGPVVLFFVPTVVSVTFTLKVHDALPARVAPVKLTTLDPAVAVMVPPPQLPVSPFGVETPRPAGKVSVNPTPVNVEALGLVIVKPREVDPPTTMLAAPNDFPIVGGAIAATMTLAAAVPPTPPSSEVTVLVVLFFVPTVVPVALTLKVHEAVAASVAPVKLTLPDPAVAATAPPPQLPVSPFGVETTSPAGSQSLKPMTVNETAALGLVRVKLSEVVPFSGTLAVPKDFTIVGGAVPAPVVIRPMRSVLDSVNHRLPSGPAVMP